MNILETHSYKNWKIEIYQNQSGSFGYHCYDSNNEESRVNFGNEGYNKTQSAIEAAQSYIDEQTDLNSTRSPIKEVGSPTEDEGRTTEDLNDL
jgi:hypothetical protein